MFFVSLFVESMCTGTSCPPIIIFYAAQVIIFFGMILDKGGGCHGHDVFVHGHGQICVGINARIGSLS